MDNFEDKIEAQLRERVAHVAPTRQSFEETLHAVTNDDLRRSILEKAPVPSPYQSLVSYIMNKNLLIGAGVAVVAIAAVIFIMQPGAPSPVAEQPTAPAPVAVNQPAPSAPAPVAPAPAAPAPIAVNAPPVGKVDTSSIDSITSGFVADANAEASSVTTDNSDQTTVNNELATYNTVKTTSYDTAI